MKKRIDYGFINKIDRFLHKDTYMIYDEINDLFQIERK